MDPLLPHVGEDAQSLTGYSRPVVDGGSRWSECLIGHFSNDRSFRSTVNLVESPRCLSTCRSPLEHSTGWNVNRPPGTGKASGTQPQPRSQRHPAEQFLRKLLEKRFAKVFEPEIVGEGFLLPGKWEAAGKMLPVQFTCQDGWLVAAWKRGPAEPKPAAKVTDATK